MDKINDFGTYQGQTIDRCFLESRHICPEFKANTSIIKAKNTEICPQEENTKHIGFLPSEMMLLTMRNQCMILCIYEL